MILMLQSNRVVTANRIAAHFGLSVRTVYRDIAALGEAGVPIAAEAGIGYSLMRGYHMPPVVFTEEEAAGLFMSGELAEQSGDDSLKRAMRSAMLKVRAVLPTERKHYLGRLRDSVSVLPSPSNAGSRLKSGSLMTVQEAVVRRRCLSLEYNTAGRGELSKRVVEPLGVVFYGRHWHMVAWCRLREGMRDFRLDRIRGSEVLEETFGGHEKFSLMEFLQSEVDECDLTPVTIECEVWSLDRGMIDLPAQLVERTDIPGGRVRVQALAYCLDWMSRWLLGMGTATVVHSPDELREKVREAALQLADHHGHPGPGKVS